MRIAGETASQPHEDAPMPARLPATRTIPALLDRALAEFPGREALVDGGLRWTFAELAGQIRRCAAAMIASGVRRGDRVAVWAPNGHRFVVAALGAVTVGAVLVPVNTRFKGAEAGWILSSSGARLLLVHNGFLGNDYLAMLREAAPEAPQLSEIVMINGEGGLPWHDFLGRDRGGVHRVLPGTAGQLQGAAVGPRCQRAAAQRVRQGAQVRAARRGAERALTPARRGRAAKPSRKMEVTSSASCSVG